MKIIITWPTFLEGEAEVIVRYLDAGVDRIHIRKPEAAPEEVARLLDAIPSAYRQRLVMHDFFEVAHRYGLHGIHLNGRHPECPSWWEGAVSISCHSLQELRQRKAEGYCREGEAEPRRFEYLSLSPIYDSVSKRGYQSAFTPEQIAEAAATGIIDARVMALGGVTFANFDATLALGFGGAMILGDAWR